MDRKSFRRWPLVFWAASGLLSSHAVAADLTTLVSGLPVPKTELYLDPKGNLLGATAYGGLEGGSGAIFRIEKTETGYANTAQFITGFHCAFYDENGLRQDISCEPNALIGDGAGNLISSFYQNRYRIAGSASVFELPLTAFGFNARRSIAEVNGPRGKLLRDADGHLYGNGESVFMIPKTPTGYGSPINLGGLVGGFTTPTMIMDAAGNLYGGLGDTIAMIAKTPTGYASTVTPLTKFTPTEGYGPNSLLIDADGNLYGTTLGGGGTCGPSGCTGRGTVFRVAKTASGYANSPTTLVTFNGSNGAEPQSGLIGDASGNLYGTTRLGGGICGGQECTGRGTVFRIAKTAGGYASAPTTLVTFYGDNGLPMAGLIADEAGRLFGTTSGGTVFLVTNAGYSPPISISGELNLQISGNITPSLPAGSKIYCRVEVSVEGKPGSSKAEATSEATMVGDTYSCSVKRTYGGRANYWNQPTLSYAIDITAVDPTAGHYCQGQDETEGCNPDYHLRSLKPAFVETIPLPPSEAVTTKTIAAGPL